MAATDQPGGHTGRRSILVRDGKSGLPFSKGILASSVLATGLSPDTAYKVAERVEDALLDRGIASIGVADLRDVVAETVRHVMGREAADGYLRWQEAQERDLPLIVLIGGTTGVGKSVVATQVATRLGIVRIVSTDSIREVLRGILTEDLLPVLHRSTYMTGEAFADLTPPSTALIAGFKRQSAIVCAGIRRVMRRAVVEGHDLIIEGVHLLPEVIEPPDPNEAITVPVMLVLEDRNAHRSHFGGREPPGRPPDRYLAYFEEIRGIQDEVIRQAVASGLPMVRSFDLDTTVAEVTALVVERVTSRSHT